jgi:hypothetical protein
VPSSPTSNSFPTWAIVSLEAQHCACVNTEQLPFPSRRFQWSPQHTGAVSHKHSLLYNPCIVFVCMHTRRSCTCIPPSMSHDSLYLNTIINCLHQYHCTVLNSDDLCCCLSIPNKFIMFHLHLRVKPRCRIHTTEPKELVR